jgi:polyisoprenoid-binding protein YceI
MLFMLARLSSLRRTLLAGGAALVIGAAGLGFGVYSYLKPTATASGPLEAVRLSTVSATRYEIQSSDSIASFTIDEVLRGSPYTVVGTTDQVAGQISFDLDNPSVAQVGKILVNARTLITDDDSRTRALGNRILNSDQYEYISFSPTALSGLPTSVSVGQPFTFQMTGDLTIKGVSGPATFEVTVTPSADGSLDGVASTTIRYADWGVAVPSVPFVASVGNQVELALDFSATAAG